MRHLIDPLDFTQQEISTLLDLADRIHDDPAAYQEVARHKKLATLFYEPSTRTRLSFEAAMLNLGGHVLGFPSENVLQRKQGRERGRHHPRGVLLCGHRGHAPPQRGRTAACCPLLPHPGDQRGRRRPPAPHPDPDRPA